MATITRLSNAISQVACQYQTGLLIDVHGKADYPMLSGEVRKNHYGWTRGSIWLGTDRGKLSLMHSFEEFGYPIHPKDRCERAPFTGRFITGTYGYPYGLNAIQLECSYSFRASKEIYLKTAQDTASASLSFAIAI